MIDNTITIEQWLKEQAPGYQPHNSVIEIRIGDLVIPRHLWPSVRVEPTARLTITHSP